MNIEIDYEESQRVSNILHTVGEGKLRSITINLGHKPRAELHLTDDLYCYLKAYCRIKLGLKADINRRTSAIFLRGILYDALFKLPFNSTEVGLSIEGCPAIGHPDVVERTEGLSPCDPAYYVGYPIEAKHTTKQIRSIEDIPKKWLQQLKLEMVYCNSLIGYLAIGEIMSTLVTVWKGKMHGKEFEGVKGKHIVNMDYLDGIIRGGFIDSLTPIRKECKGCFYNFEDGCPRRPK